MFRKLTKKFASFPPPEKFLMQDKEIGRLRASYASYLHDHEMQFSNWSRFPWEMPCASWVPSRFKQLDDTKLLLVNFMTTTICFENCPKSLHPSLLLENSLCKTRKLADMQFCFLWNVPMRKLGTIKAQATGRHKTIAGEF